MNRDLIIGILASLFLHGFILGGELLFPKGKKVVEVKKVEETTYLQMEETPPDEEPEEEIEDIEEVETPPMAPPSLLDTPTLVPPDAFRTTVTPPPPPGLTPDRSAVSVPVIPPGTKFGAGIKDLFNLADLDQQPTPSGARANPTYPMDLKRQGVEGSCTLEFIVDSNGNVSQARVVKATHREFENPAMQAVLKWRFKPGKKGGRSVNTRVQIALEFKINNSD
jgi:periplasmic protein TonB